MSPLAVTVDAAHGARISSLRDSSGREWLWRHPDAATQQQRRHVRPGAAFVDAGGIEECFPTVSGRPDHGEVWSVGWSGPAADLTVRGDQFTLRRRISSGDKPTLDTITLDYVLTAQPGFRFVWALHALLVPEPGTVLEVDEAETHSWGVDGRLSRGLWPYDASGCDVSRFGSDDGTAQFVLLPGVRAFAGGIGGITPSATNTQQVTVRQRGRSLSMTLTASEQPCALGLWRNLGGYSYDGGPPYRSLGVEPMLGHHPDRADARPCGTVPASGTVSWRLRLSCGPATDQEPWPADASYDATA